MSSFYSVFDLAPAVVKVWAKVEIEISVPKRSIHLIEHAKDVVLRHRVRLFMIDEVADLFELVDLANSFSAGILMGKVYDRFRQCLFYHPERRQGMTTDLRVAQMATEKMIENRDVFYRLAMPTPPPLQVKAAA